MIELARQWKERADGLLAESKLVDLLERHGEVHFSGSYAYDVMMSPDVDIHLVLPAFTREHAARVLLSLVEQGWWATITFADRVDERFRPPTLQGVPRGYYVGLETDLDGARWKVDVWLLDETKYRGDVWRPIMESISDEQRQAILELKVARGDERVSAAGVEIYEAVINGGVRTVAQLDRLLAATEHLGGAARERPADEP
jgi:hypothetical protein